MQASIGGEIVTLHTNSSSTADLVNEQVHISRKEESERHFCLCNLGDIIHKYQQMTTLIPRVKPFYAVKCNEELPVLKVLADLGASFDCASKHEIEKVLNIGVTPARVIYAQPCKQPSMLKFAKQKGVDKMTFDNVEELYKVKKIFPTARLVLRIMIDSEYKGNQDFSSKYGCHPLDVPTVLETAKELNLNVVGVSFHVGSNCYDSRAFSAAIQQSRQVFDTGAGLGFNMTLLDIGGGFPGQLDTGSTFQQIADVVNSSLDTHFPYKEGLEVIAEPGRYMVASAFTIGVNIIAKRIVPHRPNKQDKGTGINRNDPTVKSIMYYVNDGVYGSFLGKLADYRKYEAKSLKTEVAAVMYESSIWGPSCDSVDCIVDSTLLPAHDVGEWLYFPDMGAYTLSSHTNFNGMEEPKLIYYCQTDIWNQLYSEKSCQYNGPNNTT
ncbi:LOW QUALITY PROTEIN: ornithine decarboxylase-like [Ruditapes philippinarum]|uniref:LOW QUALITY PROTEIN: ornithine decarboxylase-like n=1 Tax=Ruditapes philippinarum TaxID=129788 RepID=UPI00295BCCE3|nr:LOW QUALITY PROTEIN: ornithine decarboxylase-like [Ruditapes philippinarum]